MTYLSDAKLRAILTVFSARAAGEISTTNGELHDAMMPRDGGRERLRVEHTDFGVRVSIEDADAP